MTKSRTAVASGKQSEKQKHDDDYLACFTDGQQEQQQRQQQQQELSGLMTAAVAMPVRDEEEETGAGMIASRRQHKRQIRDKGCSETRGASASGKECAWKGLASTRSSRQKLTSGYAGAV